MVVSSVANFAGSCAGGFRRRLVGCCAFVRIADGLGGFRRHVVLVVLGEHLGGGKDAVLAELALRDDALSLAEEVRQDALVGDGHVLVGVGDDEAQGHAVGLALQRSLLDHAADAEALAPAALRRRPPAVGEKKNTRLLWKALSTSVATRARIARPPTISAMRL
jgi:hypothetical protein